MERNLELPKGTVLELGATQHCNPPFHRIPARLFEILCLDILSKEPEILTPSDLYGNPGQAQYGIDFLLTLKDSSSHWAVQCKCQERVTVSDILEATNMFLEFKEKWKSLNVEKFVLIYACELTDTKIQDCIAAERKRVYDTSSISVEFWSARTIKEKLRPYPDIVRTYLHPPESWVESICGLAPSANNQKLNMELIKETAQLSSIIEQHADQELTLAMQLFRLGKQKSLFENLKKLPNTDRWSKLQSKLQVQYLVLLAKLAINLDLLEEAQLFVKEIKSLGLQPPPELEILIAANTTSIESALQLHLDCTDIDVLNLKARLFIGLEQPKKVFELLTESITLNAESYRVKALAHFRLSDLAGARIAIQKALEHQTKSAQIDFVSLMISFYECISPVEFPKTIPSWPAPISWSSIKRDHESLSMLSRCEDGFRKLLTTCEYGHAEKQALEGWLLASMLCNPKRSEAGAEYCKQLVSDTDLHVPALFWSVLRQLDSDTAKQVLTIEQRVSSKEATSDEVIILTNHYLSQEQSEKALLVLEQASTLFRDEEVWIHWKINCLIKIGNWEKAISLCGENSAFTNQRLAAEVSIAENMENPDEQQKALSLIAAKLESDYHRLNEPLLFLNLCQLQFRLKNWKFITDHSEEILTTVQSEDCYKLVAFSLFYQARFLECHEFLRRITDDIEKYKLSPELSLLHSCCLDELGANSDAIDLAEKIYQATKTKEALESYIEALISGGRIKVIELVAPQLLSNDVSAPCLLKVANILLCDCAEIAQKILIKACEQNLPDSLVGVALKSAIALGMLHTKTFKDLFERAKELTNEGSPLVFSLTAEQLADITSQTAEWHADLLQYYRRGDISVYTIFDNKVSRPFQLYSILTDFDNTHAQLSDDVFSRDQNRPFFWEIPVGKPQWKLVLDLTSLIVLQNLSLLEQVLIEFSPVRITHSLMRSLAAIRNFLQVYPAHDVQKWKELMTLIRQNDLKIEQENSNAEDSNLYFEERVKIATTQQCLLVNSSHDDVSTSKNVVSVADVIAALHTLGKLSKTQCSTALQALGINMSDFQAIPIALGTKLIFDLSSVFQLQFHNFLSQSILQFDAFLWSTDYSIVNAEFCKIQENSDEQNAVTRLIDTLSRGMASGSVMVLPNVLKAVEANSEDEQAAELKLFSNLLVELANIQCEEGLVLVIDDRFVNKFQLHQNGFSIFSSLEVLKGLVASQALTEVKLWQITHRLRKSSFRFLPSEGSDILFHLREAPFTDSQLVVTDQLNTLSNYVRKNIIDLGEDEGRIYLQWLRICLLDAWTKLWRDEHLTFSQKVFACDWLATNLLFDPLTLARLQSEKVDLTAVVATLAQMLLITLALPVEDRKEFCNMFFLAVVTPSMRREPLFALTLAREINRLIKLTLNDFESVQERAQWRRELFYFYCLLPEDVRNHCRDSSTLIKFIGIQRSQSLKLGDIYVRIHVLHTAIKNSLKLKAKVPLSVRENSQRYELLAVKGSDKRMQISVLDHELKKEYAFETDEMEVFANTRSMRYAALLRNKIWFDVSPVQHEHLSKKISQIARPDRRMAKLLEYQQSSLTLFYYLLRKDLIENRKVHGQDLLPPSFESIFKHLRIADASKPLDYDDAAKSLTEEFDIVDAVQTFSAFPCDLPPYIFSFASSLSDEQLRDAIRRGLKYSWTPIARFHLIKLLLFCSKRFKGCVRFARRIASYAASEIGLEELAVQKRALKWFTFEFSRQQGYRELPTLQKLQAVWYHSDCILRSIVLGKNWKPAEEFFGQTSLDFLLSFFVDEVEMRLEAANPNNFSVERLLLTGLNYAVDQQFVDDFKDLKTRISTIATFEDEGSQHPSVPVYMHTGFLPNSLKSFVQDDLVHNKFLSDEASKVLSFESFEETTSELITKIELRTISEIDWYFLAMIFRFRSMGMELQDKLKSSILGEDWFALVSECSAPHVALMFLGAQSPNYISDELEFEDAIGVLVRLCEWCKTAELEKLSEFEYALLEFAIRLCSAPQFSKSSSESIARLNTLFLQFLDTNSELAQRMLEVVSLLWKYLPVQTASILFRLRQRLEYACRDLEDLNA